jgi:predicted transcriptional regulator of viral defense system
MQLHDELNNFLQKKKIITTEEFVSLGYSKMLLTKYVRAGLLERVHHGVYALPNSAQDDMWLLSKISEYIVFSHDSALFLNGLSERTPFVHSITIPSNKTLPKTAKGTCICYYIKPNLYEIGIIERKTTFGNLLKCYDAERTICDILRSRNRLDEETVISAIKNYAGSSGKDLNKLSFYAEQLHATKKLKQYLEVLL